MYFNSLNYTLGDEDASVEHGLLTANDRHVVAVAGSGSRVIPLLARAPEKLTCIDISPLQLALTRLRLEAVAVLELEDYLGFMGYKCMASRDRARIFKFLRSRLPVALPEPLPRLINNNPGLIYQGRFEKMLRQLWRVNKLLTRGKGEGLFDCATLDEQRRYLKERFPRKRWALVVGILGNATVLNALLYRGEFPRKNLPGSSAGIYRRIFNRLFQGILARNSFFLQMIFLGELKYSQGYMLECNPEIYHSAKKALRKTELNFVQGDVIQHMAMAREVSFASLSDVPSFLEPERSKDFLQAIKPGLARNATVVTRGHLRVVTPDATGFCDRTENHNELTEAETTQLWRIAVYRHM